MGPLRSIDHFLQTVITNLGAPATYAIIGAILLLIVVLAVWFRLNYRVIKK